MMDDCSTPRSMSLSNLLLALLMGVLALVVWPAHGQIEEDDLPAESYSQIAYERLPMEELESRYSAAESTYLEAADPDAAIAAFSDLIEILQERLVDQQSTPQEEGLLARSLGYRARINFNQALEAEVDADLERLLAVAPGFAFDSAVVSPKLLERFNSLKKARTGELEIILDPPDAEVLVDGRQVNTESGLIGVRAGTLTITVRRPGYATVEMPLEVRGGRKVPLDLRLERTSATLLLVTRPVGAKVFVDDQEVGETAGQLPSNYPLTGDAARFARAEFSAPLLVGDLQVGRHRVEVREPGFRSYGIEVDVPELKDYNAGIAVLKKAEGTILLRRLPQGAKVSINGESVRPVPVNNADGRLLLPPGSYRLGVTDGTTGFFEANLDLIDGQTQEVKVELRPALTLLGILGGDRPAARKLFGALGSASAELEGWTFLERTEEGETTLAELGFEAPNLRKAAEQGLVDGTPRPTIEWRRLQEKVDRSSPGSVYVVAVLSDDLLAAEADLWFLPTAPAPASPDRRRIRLDKADEVTKIIQAFNRPFELDRAWFGALLIDSAAAEGPVVASLNPESPAAKAGVRVGDQILSIFGEKVESAFRAQTILQGLRPGSSFSVELGSAAGRRTLDVDLGQSPAVVPLDSRNLMYAAVAAAVARASKDPENTTPPWLLQMNQAAVFLNGGAWKDAVRVLRAIQAPKGPGLGQAAVDYWLAIALKAIGPEYQDQAKAALRRAAAVEGGRLFHNDGPLVAPRARARLLELGG